MTPRERLQAALDEHHPRPVGDPLYVPYWAKGAYARAHGTSYTLEDGSVVRAGEIMQMGTGASRSASSAAELPKYRAGVERSSEVPAVRPATPSRDERPPAKEPDAVAKLLREHSTPEQRRALCERYGIDWTTIASAPNPGVGSMRLANALRKGLG